MSDASYNYDYDYNYTNYYDYVNNTSEYVEKPEDDGHRLATVLSFSSGPRNGLTAQKFLDTFYPAAFLVSSVFLFLTLIVFALVRDLRKNLFGKITVGFLINAFFCYLLNGLRWTIEGKVSPDVIL